jgi:hypothetical protein
MKTYGKRFGFMNNPAVAAEIASLDAKKTASVLLICSQPMSFHGI